MPVEAVARNEIVMASLFDDVSIIENDDLVRIGDGSQAMGDDDYRLARAEGSDCSLNERGSGGALSSCRRGIGRPGGALRLRPR